MPTGPPQTETGSEKTCYGFFFAVTTMFNSLDAELLQAYTVELVNLPYAVRAATVTLNAKNAKDNQARQNDLKKANEKFDYVTDTGSALILVFVDRLDTESLANVFLMHTAQAGSCANAIVSLHNDGDLIPEMHDP
jgi:hypothetical protein